MGQVVDGRASQDRESGGQASPKPPPILPRLSPSGDRGPNLGIKKRPHSLAADCSTSDTLVSSWLDGVYPNTRRRRRRYSVTAIDDVTNNNLNDEQNNQNKHNTHDKNDGQDRQKKDDKDDSHGRHSQNSQGNRTRAKSEPVMARGCDDASEGSAAPASSAALGADGATTQGSSRSKNSGSSPMSGNSALVDSYDYRLGMEETHGITMRGFRRPLPAAIQALVDRLGLEQPAPTPTDGDKQHVTNIAGHTDWSIRPMETVIRSTFDNVLFPTMDKPTLPLMRIDSMPMQKETMPAAARPQLKTAVAKLSLPVPDILYGYRRVAFPLDVRLSLRSSLGNLLVVNNSHLTLPFFLIEFKGDGGSMWSCGNQCLGGSVACVNVGRRLNTLPRKQEPFNSAVFSMSMNNDMANLFVTWRPDPDDEDVDPGVEYYMQAIDHFILRKDDQFLVLQRTIRRIIEWGEGERRDHVMALLGTGKKRKERDEEEDPNETSKKSTKVTT